MSKTILFKDKKKYLLFNIILFAFLILAINFNNEHLIPAFKNINIIVNILGSLPNFLVSFIISLFILRVAINKTKGRIIFYLFSALICGLLIFEEYLPIINTSRIYDVFDIIGSVIGMIFANLTFEIILHKIKKSTN